MSTGIYAKTEIYIKINSDHNSRCASWQITTTLRDEREMFTSPHSKLPNPDRLQDGIMPMCVCVCVFSRRKTEVFWAGRNHTAGEELDSVGEYMQ